MTEREAEVKTQELGEIIKPIVPDGTIKDLVWRQYGLRVKHWVELNSYDDKNYHVIAEDQSDNPYITEVSSNGYVLKVLNSLESKRPVVIDAQHSLMEHLSKRGIKTQEVIKNKDGKSMSLEKIYSDDKNQDGNAKFGTYVVRMLSYIPGEIVHVMPYVPLTFYNIGKFVASMHNAIEGFHHDFYETYNTLWSLKEIERLKEFVFVLKNPEDHRVVTEIIQAFTDHVKPIYDRFSEGIIHGDLNEQNILVDELPNQDTLPKNERACEVRGILDFADVTKSYKIFDVAIAISYLSIECKLIDQRDVGGHFLAGYLAERDLNEDERQALRVCVCARLIQSLVLGAYSHHLDPSNTYVLTTSAMGWPLLHKLWKTSEQELYKRWNDIIKNYAS
ncbi:hypothetical protein FSP39_009043 [Pinctada imbricata]|uniref:Hydroxylysine kinase n=1 Tax=Pinctada imbricata TaxID=66713 RepID=A0AA88Y9R7_PINIB|nr:hypothetical protein FSP39_009043 [Pinctada imbricata]